MVEDAPPKTAPDNDPSPAYTRSRKKKTQKKKNEDRVEQVCTDHRTETISMRYGPSTSQDFASGYISGYNSDTAYYKVTEQIKANSSNQCVEGSASSDY